MSRDPFPFLAQFLFDGLSQTSFRSSHLFFIFQPREEETQLSHASVNPLVRYVDFCLSLSLTEFPACTPLSLSLSLSLSLFISRQVFVCYLSAAIHGENFMAIFTTLCVVIWFSTSILGIFVTLFYVITTRMIICDILRMAIIPTLWSSILFCNLCYILLWISPRSVVKIAIRI